MNIVRADFNGRVSEIDAYLGMVEFIDDHSAALTGRDGVRKAIDLPTQQVLKASVYLHLYNLVESTITACLREVGGQIRAAGLSFGDLTDEWRRSWMSHQGKTAEPLAAESRLAKTAELCEMVLSGQVVDFVPKIPGNLDDTRIEKLARRHGLDLSTLPQAVRSAVKRPVVNDDGIMKVVRRRRNDLAHGFSTFSDCGRGVAVPDLKSYRDAVVDYLRAVIDAFEAFVRASGFKAGP